MKTAIIICTRKNSSRVPNKPFVKINGKPIIEHLLDRLIKTGLEIYLAIPDTDTVDYLYLQGKKNVFVHESRFREDPLARMNEVAEKFKIDTIVRVTHDKILVDPEFVSMAAEQFKENKNDYLFSSRFIPGTGFEIISSEIIKAASAKWKNVEFISYAARTLATSILDFDPGIVARNHGYRFLIDFPEDVKLLEIIFSQIGNDATALGCIQYLKANPDIKEINQQPTLTVYTCVYNGAEHIERAMGSVQRQRGFREIEYIIVDDFSNDSTIEKVHRFCIQNPNAYWIRNSKNLGLASSSNIALKAARGKYIMRLDADDYLVSTSGLKEMVSAIEKQKTEAVYPNNYYGNLLKVQRGEEERHVGGAIFDKRALNHLQFTDGLRGYEGLDLFLRAESQLKIGYLEKPIFFYTQREGSLSKVNLQEREKIKKEIIEAYQ